MQLINKTLPLLFVCMGRDVICASVFADIIVFSIAELKADDQGVNQRTEIN